MRTGLNIEHNYWHSERLYDLHLFLRTHRTGVPEPFRRVSEQLNKKDYLIYTQKYAFMYPEAFLSGEFKKRDFIKRRKGNFFNVKTVRRLSRYILQAFCLKILKP